jgi:hypothetical protein
MIERKIHNTADILIQNFVASVNNLKIHLILQRVLGTPLEMAPAKARCSNGDR